MGVANQTYMHYTSLVALVITCEADLLYMKYDVIPLSCDRHMLWHVTSCDP